MRTRRGLRADFVAGVSVCVVMIPSVLAYAELAGLPPQYGLYAALAAMIGYALFASSRQVIAGPDAVALPTNPAPTIPIFMMSPR